VYEHGAMKRAAEKLHMLPNHVRTVCQRLGISEDIKHAATERNQQMAAMNAAGLSDREIAQVLGMSRGGVNVLRSRAMGQGAALKKIMERVAQRRNQVVELRAAGLLIREIAACLDISPNQVSSDLRITKLRRLSSCQTSTQA
jgi:DNA-binding CsgD family transcriptional regulator